MDSTGTTIWITVWQQRLKPSVIFFPAAGEIKTPSGMWIRKKNITKKRKNKIQKFSRRRMAAFSCRLAALCCCKYSEDKLKKYFEQKIPSEKTTSRFQRVFFMQTEFIYSSILLFSSLRLSFKENHIIRICNFIIKFYNKKRLTHSALYGKFTHRNQ